MSSVPPQNGWMGASFNYTYDHVYEYAADQIQGSAHLEGHIAYRDHHHRHPYHHNSNSNTSNSNTSNNKNYYGASSSSSVQPQSRSVSRPRVDMACKHCRQRKVRCDGKKPKCSLCTRLNRACDYVKVTAEENAVLRDKKRKSKMRKNAEQEAARAKFHKHDTFPVYHPYRPAVTVHRSSVGSDTQRADDRLTLHPPRLPQVLGSAICSSSTQQQQGMYDARTQTQLANITMMAGGGTQDRVRRLSSTSLGGPVRRMANSSYVYPREQDNEVMGYVRTSMDSEQRMRYNDVHTNDNSCGSGVFSNPNANTSSSMVGASVNLVGMMPTQAVEEPTLSRASTSYRSFRSFSPTDLDRVRNDTTTVYSQRTMGTIASYEPVTSANQFDQHDEPSRQDMHFGHSNPNSSNSESQPVKVNSTLTLALPTSGQQNLSVSPSIASPGYLPALVTSRAPSSTCSHASASTSASPASPQNTQHPLDKTWSTITTQPTRSESIHSHLSLTYRPTNPTKNTDSWLTPSHPVHLSFASHPLVSLYSPPS